MLIASFPETSEIGKKIASALKVQYTTIKVSDFPDSEFHLILKKNPAHEVVVILNSLSKNPDEKLVESVLAAGVAKDYRAKKVVLAATYLPYMRQDTHFLKYDSFSAKHIVKMLNEFDHIIALDPHLHRIRSMKQLSKKAESITSSRLVADFIKRHFGRDYTIVGPDEESRELNRSVAKLLGRKAVILRKVRHSPTKVRIREKKLGSNVIVIDDIISTGHTIAETLKIAKRQGARRIICIGIHGVLVKGAAERIMKYAKLITTNSILNPYAKIDVSPVFVDALRKYHN